MRILYVCSDWGIPPDGTKGASIHLRAITHALADLGHEVLLLSPKGLPGNGHPALPTITERCDLAEDSARLLRDWLAERELPGGIGKEIRPLLFNAWAVDRFSKELSRNPPDAIIERLSLFGHLGLDLADALQIPLIVEVNAPLTIEATQFRSLQLQGLALEIEQRVLRRADRIAVVSRELGEFLAAQGVDPARISVVPNGIDTMAFGNCEPRSVVRRRLGIDEGFVVGFAGSLKPWHGVELLVEAFQGIAASDPRARLLIIGTGPSEKALNTLIENRNLSDRVLMTGAVDHHQVPSMLAAMDVAVAPFLPISDFYFSPIKLFEYMASGACVVASRLGQIAQVIDSDLDGILCEPGDVESLRSALERARLYPALRKEMGRRARAKAFESYTWTRAARQMEALIESQIGTRRVAITTSNDALLSKAS